MSQKPVTGRAKGGRAVAEKMTPEQLSDRGRRGAVGRWGDKPISAIKKGNFKDEFGVDVDCYVCNDRAKTAVISQTGMARVLGLSPTGGAFPRFINSSAMSESVGAELRAKLEKPLVIQWGSGGAEQPSGLINGFDAAVLIEVCNAVADAHRKGNLGKRYEKVIQQASIINGASAKAGIKGLVYALAGYRPEIEEVIQAFKVYVLEEAKKYEQEFPPELYLAWHRLYQIPIPVRGKPWHFKHLTLRHIYYPLAKSNGKLLELLKAEKAKDGDRQKKLFQFLSAIGTRALRVHMGRVLEMAESSVSEGDYERKITERFGGQQELELVVPS